MYLHALNVCFYSSLAVFCPVYVHWVFVDVLEILLPLLATPGEVFSGVITCVIRGLPLLLWWALFRIIQKKLPGKENGPVKRYM